MIYDVTVIGGGVVGLSTAYNLSLKYNGNFALVEKEPELGCHQSTRNSGVLHAGFYKPGSEKSDISVAGRRRLIEFCDEHGVKYDLCGKVIVATNERESLCLRALFDYARQNGFDCRIIGRDELRELEPYVTGEEVREAILSPETGIIDTKGLIHAYAEEAGKNGADVFTGAKVIGIVQKDGIYLETTHPAQAVIETRNIINCAGLYADKIAEMCGLETGIVIVPIRGEYYRLTDEKRYLANRCLIYQTPDPRTPFLGVHFTKTLDGEVKVGPNAVLAFAREGYARSDVNPNELMEMLFTPGFWKMGLKYMDTVLSEAYHALVKPAYVHNLRRIVPEIESRDLLPATSGVRAQAVDKKTGKLFDDIVIKDQKNAIHLLSVQSPALTGSLAMGENNANRAAELFGLEKAA